MHHLLCTCQHKYQSPHTDNSLSHVPCDRSMISFCKRQENNLSWHSLAYVCPSVPHTGLKIGSHSSGQVHVGSPSTKRQSALNGQPASSQDSPVSIGPSTPSPEEQYQWLSYNILLWSQYNMELLNASHKLALNCECHHF